MLCMSAPAIRLDMIVLDTADVAGLAAFYSDLLGGEVGEDDETWWTVRLPGATTIAAQLAPDHQPPRWPDGPPQQVHLDFDVDDITSAHAHALAVGARQLSEEGPGGREHGFVVYADPAGHPFCLCW